MNAFQRKLLFALFLVSFLLLAVGMNRDIWTANEGQRAYPPIEMLLSGDWVVPRLNGDPYMKKPPLLYWMLIPLYSVFGIHEWVARLPSVASGLATVAVVFAWGLRLFQVKESAGQDGSKSGLFDAQFWPAFIAAAIVATNMVFIDRGRNTDLDIHLCLFTTLAMWSMWQGLQGLSEGRGERFWGVALACGGWLALANLLKIPVPFLFIGPGLVGVCLLAKRKDWLFRWEWVVAFGVSVVPFLIWAFWASLRVGSAEVSETFREELELRVHASEINRGPIVFYLALSFGAFFPWCLGWLCLLNASIRRKFLGLGLTAQFLGSAVGFSLVALSLIPAKESEYMVSAVPLMALLMGFLIYSWAEEPFWAPKSWSMSRKKRVILWAGFVIACVFGLAKYLQDEAKAKEGSFKEIAATMSRYEADGFEVLIYRKKLPSLFYYLQTKYPRLRNSDEVADRMAAKDYKLLILLQRDLMNEWEDKLLLGNYSTIEFPEHRSNYLLLELHTVDLDEEDALPLGEQPEPEQT
ncbi:MAG: ArnT family glycosyltransferase [Sumerlaeia bacterium]